MSVHSQFYSDLLVRYHRAPDHISKLRIWTALRRLSGFARIRVRLNPRGVISVDERDYLQHCLLSDGVYEPEVMGTLGRFADSAEVLWDIGANVGSVTVAAMNDPRFRAVHAFEPDPVHAKLLRQNVGFNTGPAFVHELALSSKDEERVLRHAVFPHTGGSTFLEHSEHGRFEGENSVSCATGERLIREGFAPSPTLIKADVEGWELEVFRGMEPVFQTRPPKAVVFEGDADESGRLTSPGLEEWFNSVGYKVSHLRRADGTCYHRENYLAVPR